MIDNKIHDNVAGDPFINFWKDAQEKFLLSNGNALWFCL